jgi:hypothetical protein
MKAIGLEVEEGLEEGEQASYQIVITHIYNNDFFYPSKCPAPNRTIIMTGQNNVTSEAIIDDKSIIQIR